MARAKRVSVKGMGADLFFGDVAPSATAAPDAKVLPNDPHMDETPTDHHPPATPPQRPRRPARQDPQPNASIGDAASMLASAMDSTSASLDPAIIEQIRKTVKVPGKEVSFVRLTPAEKGDLADIVYTYKRQGLKTTENEINRIAVNFMLLDYQEHGEESLLAKVLAALRA